MKKIKRVLENTSELELILQAKSGSEKAFTELYDRYKVHIKHNLTTRLRSITKAEDMMQIVFMKAFTRIHTFEPSFKFSTWIFRIALNSIIDESRENKLETVSLSDLSDSCGERREESKYSIFEKDGEKNPQERTESDQKHSILHKIIEEELSTPDKLFVQLFYFQELKLEEIAEELEIPLGTVKATLFRIRNKMRNSTKLQNLNAI